MDVFVRKVNDNYNQQITNRKDQYDFGYMTNNIFDSLQLPAIIITKIQNHFYMATLSPIDYNNLEYKQSTDINGQPKMILVESSLYRLFTQMYSTLNWKPIENLVNYPVNENFLQELGITIQIIH